MFKDSHKKSEECRKILELAKSKRQEMIKSEKHLIDEMNHNKNHPESSYTSRPLSKLIRQVNSLQINKDDILRLMV